MERFYFKNAEAVWAAGRETEKNLQLAFRTVVNAKKADCVELRIAAAYSYKAYMNGRFVAHGPARCGKGSYFVDVLDFGAFVVEGENTIAVEVSGCNVNSYMFINQPSFLAAEAACNGEPVRSTGCSSDFECRVMTERVQKVQRYSFQRPFVEVYRCGQGPEAFRKGVKAAFESPPLAAFPAKTYYKRIAPYPEFEKLRAARVCGAGTVDFAHVCAEPLRDRSLVCLDNISGYALTELETVLSDEMQNMSFAGAGQPAASAAAAFGKNTYQTYAMPNNASGMIGFSVRCGAAVTVYAMFDEILTDGDVSTTRMGCCNGVKYTLEPGAYDLLSHEAYTFKYIKFAVDGQCEVADVHIIEVKHPPVPLRVKIPADNAKLRVIYDAAVETFRQNAVDIFMDCPSRERAGWLCDSFFTARVENCLTGGNAIERAFLSNFGVASDFAPLPEGMLPMCYPGDHGNGRYIPNWAMWFVLELREYVARTGDAGLALSAKRRVLELMKFFEKYENEFGLLEKLESWVFIEWSPANQLTQDVSYPTNMLYAGMLEAAGALYGEDAFICKAGKIRATIRAMSYDGDFFTDNAVRNAGGKLENTKQASEVCQYFAFFFDVATPATHAKLWKVLVDGFGPERKRHNAYPQICFANMFVGNYLRLDILQRYGYDAKLLENVEGYFYEMAQRTGTLWENDNESASCNHGFASHVACWLANIFGTEKAARQ